MNLDSTDSTLLFGLLVVLICLPVLFKTGGFCSWQYLITRLKAYNYLRKQKRKLELQVDLRRDDLTPLDVGILPSPLEYELEKPSTNTFKHSDGIHFMGISSEGDLIDLCINRIEENKALVWVVLILSDGSVYKMPFNHDTRTPYISNENMWSTSGLQIKCLSPLRKWRVSFNGLLEKCNSTDEKEEVHVKFSFVWLAMSVVQELNMTYDATTLAKAFNNEHVIPGKKDFVRLQECQNRFEQWGQMMGTIHFPGEEEKELYFWSARTRIMDTPLWNEDITSAKFYMYFVENSGPLKIESVSIKKVLSNLYNGYTVTPQGAAKSVSNCTLIIKHLEENMKKVKFSFSLQGKLRKIGLSFVGKSVMVYTGPDLQQKLLLRPFKVCMDKKEFGYGILHYLSKSENEVLTNFEAPPLLLESPKHCLNDKQVLSLEESECRSPEVAGGKGSSLAMLMQLSKQTDQFVVPKGLVLSTKAYNEHLHKNKQVHDAILQLKDVSCKKNKDLKIECNKCTKIFESTDLSEDLKRMLEAKLFEVFGSVEDKRFSVRSSACGEDSEDLSAAGQMLTVLGIRGINGIYQAVIQCWASKFGFEYIQYVRQNGQSILSSMAVVVQEMVPSNFSGVMFTTDPVTGDPSHPYLTANYGLGETVVSAQAEPDTIILKRIKDQPLQVYEKQIGSKKVQVFMRSSDGVEQKTYKSQSACCLTDSWALKIGRIGILVESCYCSPRDIEWAVSKEKLYLLQARPITTLHYVTDFELIHDQDTPVRSIHDYWTRANTGEVFLGASSPLGISLVVGGMDIYGHRSYVLREGRCGDFCPYYFHTLPVTHKQVTLNLLDTLLRTNEKEISSVQKAFEVALFGRSVITKEIHEAAIRKHGYASWTKRYMGLLFIFLLTKKIPKSVADVKKKLEEYSVPLETFNTSRKAFDGILGQMNFYSIIFSVHGMATFLSSYFNMLLLTTLSKNKTDWDSELYCDFATMLSSCTGVESADVPESLQELARHIAKTHGDEFTSFPADVAYNLLKNDTSDSGVLFQRFIKRHGHRCVKEFDVFSKSWEMEPENLVPTLQNMVRSPNILDVATKSEMSTEEILSKIKTPLSSWNKKLLKIFLPITRKYLCEREKTKSLVIKSVDWLRKTCYLLGDLMVEDGLLPDRELVFFLSIEEIQEVLESQRPGLVQKAIRRMRLHPHLNDLKFPEIIQGIPKPTQTEQDYSKYSASFTLKGTPVCQGKIKGKAVVVLSLEEASKIKSGDILITHATDIGWSPYFPLVSGVVTVLGGLISHGAVVAREYGLPCVVGVENATFAFKTGDTVILNGTNGTVTKVLDEK